MTFRQAYKRAYRGLRRGDSLEAIGRQLGPMGPQAVLAAKEALERRKPNQPEKPTKLRGAMEAPPEEPSQGELL